MPLFHTTAIRLFINKSPFVTFRSYMTNSNVSHIVQYSKIAIKIASSSHKEYARSTNPKVLSWDSTYCNFDFSTMTFNIVKNY